MNGELAANIALDQFLKQIDTMPKMTAIFRVNNNTYEIKGFKGSSTTESLKTTRSRKAQVYESSYRKRRKGIIYRMIVVEYEDGSGEKFLVPPEK